MIEDIRDSVENLKDECRVYPGFWGKLDAWCHTMPAPGFIKSFVCDKFERQMIRSSLK